MRVLVEDQEDPGDQQERGADSEPAAARDGDRVDAARLGAIDDPVAQDHGADDRRHGQGDDRGEDEDDDDRTDGVADVRDEEVADVRDHVIAPDPGIADDRGDGHAAGRPGTGNRSTMSRTSPARRACSAGSSRRRIASMMIVPIARISSGPNPREVAAGVPIRIPDAVFGGGCRTGSRSC